MRRLIAKTALRPKRKRSGKTVRPRARPGFNRRRALALAAGLSLALSLVGSAWLWHSGWLGRQADRLAKAAYGLTADAGFAVDDVLVEGRRRTDPAAILAALRVARGTPILALDPEAARALIEALPWVRRVTIERRLPSVIYVRLAERQPLAIWQLDGQLSVIDRDGEVIPGVPAKQFADLPLVVGPGASGHAADLVAMLDREPDLRPLVTAAVRVSGRRWNLRLQGGIDVRLPEDDPAEAWLQLARLEREHGLLGRDVVAIDLRLPGRLVVRTAPDARIGNTASEAGHNT
jgi:cell division protein FtsQ